MRRLAICAFTWLMLWPAVSRCQEADNQQGPATISPSKVAPCTCQPECRCDKTRTANADVVHLYWAAENLRAAGLASEAEVVLAQMHTLLRELLVDSVAERVQAEVERLRDTKGPREKIVIRISSTTAKDNELDLGLDDDEARMAIVCKPSHAIIHTVQEAKGYQRRRIANEKLMSWPDEEPEEKEDVDAPKLVAQEITKPGPSQVNAQPPGRPAAASRQLMLHVQIAEVSLTNLEKLGLQLPGGESAQDNITFHHAKRAEVTEFMESARKENILKVLAQTNLLAPDGRPVSFVDGGEIPTPRVGRDRSMEIEFKQFGTQIDAVASLLENGQVRLWIRPSYSQLIPAMGIEVGGIKVPALSVHSLDTGCDVTPGNTVVLGGRIQQRVHNGRRLGKAVPVRNEVQTLFLVTPELVEAQPPEVVDAPLALPAPTAQAPAATRKQ